MRTMEKSGVWRLWLHSATLAGRSGRTSTWRQGYKAPSSFFVRLPLVPTKEQNELADHLRKSSPVQRSVNYFRTPSFSTSVHGIVHNNSVGSYFLPFLLFCDSVANPRLIAYSNLDVSIMMHVITLCYDAFVECHGGDNLFGAGYHPRLILH